MNPLLATIPTARSLRLTVGQLILVALEFRVHSPHELSLLPTVSPQSLTQKLTRAEHEDLRENPLADQALDLAVEFLNNTERYVLGTAMVTAAMVHDKVARDARITTTELINQENLSSMNEALVLALGLNLGAAVLDNHPQILGVSHSRAHRELINA